MHARECSDICSVTHITSGKGRDMISFEIAIRILIVYSYTFKSTHTTYNRYIFGIK